MNQKIENSKPINLPNPPNNSPNNSPNNMVNHLKKGAISAVAAVSEQIFLVAFWIC